MSEYLQREIYRQATFETRQEKACEELTAMARAGRFSKEEMMKVLADYDAMPSCATQEMLDHIYRTYLVEMAPEANKA